MKIEKHAVIESQALREELWHFYYAHFEPLNERTPLAQSLDRGMFEKWMDSPEAAKFVIRNGEHSVVGFAVVSSDLGHDPLALVSETYFRKHHSGKRIYHFPAIALADEMRSSAAAYRALMVAMIAELPRDAIGVFFHSASVNPAMARLVRRACHPRVAVKNIDAMECALCTWAIQVEDDST